ncbi:hypothetical protein HZA56_11660 [Candidatus Poribacteria bacterium]|nr:hypothetical protein [Candidatus Poribacteria bacterium]
METIVTVAVTLPVAVLTLLTGFGLGTALTPVFAIFYDVKLAVLMVAIVHLLNNAFKLYLFRAHVDFAIIRRFCLRPIFALLLRIRVCGITGQFLSPN